MKNSKVIIVTIVSTAIVLLAGISTFLYVSINAQNISIAENEQKRKDTIFSQCMERTKTETVGVMGNTWINKDGDEDYCRKQMEK